MNVALENEESTNANNIQEVMEEVEEVVDNQEDTPELLSSAEVTEDESDEEGEIGFETEVVATDFQQGHTLQEEMKTPEIIETKKIPAIKKRQATVQERSISKLRDQVKSQIDRGRTMQDLIKGMQRQLLRIDKVIYASNKQKEIVGRLQVRLNELQKRLEQVAKAKVANTGAAKTKKKSNKTKTKTKAKSKLKTKKKSNKKRSKNK
jgi:hypothetical protein